MGYCKFECKSRKPYCCLLCPKQEKCDYKCDTMDSYKCAEECPNYVKEDSDDRVRTP